jgi:FAD/FMN-containing dehydrogenase
LRKVAGIVADDVRPLTYPEMQATNPLLPFGLRHYWKGHFLRSLPDDLVEFSAAHAQGRPESGFATVLIEFINGAPLRVPNQAMAFNQREATVNASALAIWADPAADAEHAAWARSYTTAISSQATGVEYVNYISENTPVDRLRAIYGSEKFARLQALKARFDPGNVFRFNQNIPPQ